MGNSNCSHDVSAPDKSENHPYYKLKIPKDTPFELKASAGKGWGAFATRKIPRGSLILREEPLLIIRKSHEEITEQDVELALEQATPRIRNQFRLLRDNVSEHFETKLKAFDQNYFDSGFSNTSIILCILHARINHSCIPNSTIPRNKEEVVASYAIKDIEAGQEITFCYSDFERRNRRERHEILGFECTCKAFDLGIPFQVLSDLRRVFIRGLQFLMIGRDLDGRSPPISDHALKKKAEEFQISLANRLVYDMLILCLLEEEELLDEALEKKLLMGVENAVRLFEDRENGRVAREALAKGSWRERFWAARGLWGE